MKQKLTIIGLLSLLSALFFMAATPTTPVSHPGKLIVEGTSVLKGSATLESTISVTGAATFESTIIHTPQEHEITSPTLTIDVTGLNFIILNSDENTTGVTLTNGTVGQVVTFVTGAGSHTIRFDDDSSTMSLGGNITLTESETDSLTLFNYATRQWARLANKDN